MVREASRQYKGRCNAAALDWILRYAQEHGQVITPQAYLEAARHPEHPGHGDFTWDDGVAAEKWRLHQARMIIGSIRVMEDRTWQKEFHAVNIQVMEDPDARYRGYAQLPLIDESLDYQQQVAKSAVSRMRNFLRDYHNMRDRWPAVFAAIEEAISREEREAAG